MNTITMEQVVEALRAAGYTTVEARTVPVEKFKKVVKTDPVRGEFTDLEPDHGSRVDIFCAPDSVLNEGTKNFACLAVMEQLADQGVTFAEHAVFARTSILSDIRISQGADEATKGTEGT